MNPRSTPTAVLDSPPPAAGPTHTGRAGTADHPMRINVHQPSLEVFIGAGFDPRGALHATRLFTGFLYGHIQDELQEQVHNPDETDDLLRLGLHRLPLTQFPRLRSLATVLASYDGAAELDEGLDIVIAGLRSQLLN
jgi:Tetracyclin repressor-like, C-terminal domain